jgi:PAS domain S-box-containing protein
LWEDNDYVLVRRRRDDGSAETSTTLALLPTSSPATPTSLARLAHQYELKDELDGTWALRPISLEWERGQPILVFEDPGGEALERFLGAPMETGRFLHLAVGVAAALDKTHQRGIVHKDVRPANVFVSGARAEVRLTGFGVASRLLRERQSPEPPESIAGTLAYMAPEQTGRMNRSIDSRSDLYALGVTYYQMLTGHLPFTASDPMEWVHCHIAREAVPPRERQNTIPACLSAIVMKLLAKTADERYQTAAGVERDLRRCIAEWQTRSWIDEFPLGEHDTPDRLLIPEKLYGRTREIDALLASFNKVVATGRPELVLVSGYSGIGKSSLVNELHKALVPPRGLFASGKFDQYKRDIPYATLAQAFQSLVRPLLGRSEADLNTWRQAFLETLHPNGQLMVDLVPELGLILGEQPAPPDLPPQDAQSRFWRVFRRFIGVFARPEHPLALFLDDLQWLDSATLDFLEDLLTRGDVSHLLLIGAYRDNEVDSNHPLVRKFEAIRKVTTSVQQIVLGPLTREHFQLLISDSLCCEPEDTTTLAQLVHEKTIGNPFFAIHFISELAEKGLLAFDHSAARWSWDLDRISAEGYTDNVVDLLVAKLNRLPAQTQRALELLACVGNSAEDALLARAYEGPGEELRTDLWDAVQIGLVFHSEGTYRFLHDRVQEAAYSQISEEARGLTHLRIGRLLASRIAPAEIEGRVFEIVNQLNRASHLITSPDERTRVARLNLIAGTRARASTAYVSAIEYLAAGRALLGDSDWGHNHELIFRIELQTAECELLTANKAAAERRLSILAERAETMLDVAAVARLRLTLYTILSRGDRAVEACLEYLRRDGTDWSPHPTRDQAQREYDRLWPLLDGRSIEELIDLPLMTDPRALAALDLLTEIVTPASFTDENLRSLVICRMVNLSLEHGNSDGSSFAYVMLGNIAGPLFGDYGTGFRFGQLGLDLVEKLGLRGFEARTYLGFGHNVMPWTRHIRAGRDLIRRAFEIADRIGDVTFAFYSRHDLIENLLWAGDPLDDTQREAEKVLGFAQKARFDLAADIIKGRLCLIRMLRGLSYEFGRFNDAEFDELLFERHLVSDVAFALPECWYWIRKLQAFFFAGDYFSAIEASAKAEQLLWTSGSFFEITEYEFYSALSRSASWDTAPVDERQPHFKALTAHHKQIEVWAANCPDNFQSRSALVSAEIARIEGRDLDAMRLYEQAVQCARSNRFVHHEGVASEVAGRFYLSRGLETNAYAHLRNAAACFGLWGADGKVAQLESLYPDLAALDRRKPVAESLGQLDVATIVSANQTVSGEITQSRLIERLMTIALQNAGADRGLLLLSQKDGYRVEAEACASGDNIVLRQDSSADQSAPDTVIRYVMRTREPVILDDSSSPGLFAEDEYLRRRRTRSLLCLPLVRQGSLSGLLYLENTLTTHAFTPGRTAVLEFLATQAAISLENTRLYADLQEREAKVRRLVDSNIIGIFIWGSDDRIIDANDAFLRLLEYDRDDLELGRLDWRELTPPEWREADEQRAAELNATGVAQAYEKEYFRKSGERAPVLVGTAIFEGRTNEGVSFVVDLTDRNRAEAAVRESEARYREVQMALAHANRVATMGQLSASIAHEINQPIAAAITYAKAGLLWLRAQPPDLEEVRQALSRIVASAGRADDVIGRLRALFQKAPPRNESLEINEAILEVVALVRGEAAKNGVSVQTELSECLSAVYGDRVQLQQVILNLLINSIDAMSGSGEGRKELLISTNKADQGGVLVTVRDSGPGLTPETVERLFEPFYTTKPGGLGMGLSICRSIIEAHEGQLWGTANVPRGAMFQFTLPEHPSIEQRAPALG